MAKFFTFLEASAEAYWHVPEFELWRRADDQPAQRRTTTSERRAGEIRTTIGRTTDDDGDELFSAAYEDMIYRDSTDDGVDAELVRRRASGGTDFELEEEAQRLGRRLGVSRRRWPSSGGRPPSPGTRSAPSTERRELFDSWQSAGHRRATRQLLGLDRSGPSLRDPPAQRHARIDGRIRSPADDQGFAARADHRHRASKRPTRAGCSPPRPAATNAARAATTTPTTARRSSVLRAVLAGDADGGRASIGPSSSPGSPQQELLYVPLAKGGKPRRIVRARALVQLIQDLLGWLPRLGLVRETCQLLDVAQTMEAEHPVGPGAVTEYDRLFTCGYQAIVRCLVDVGRRLGRSSASWPRT